MIESEIKNLVENFDNMERAFMEAREKEFKFSIDYNEAKKASLEAWKAARTAEKAIRKALLQRASKMTTDNLISLFEK